MAVVICAATTLTASWADMGDVASVLGSWAENRSGGTISVRLKHVKAAAQSGGYPVVRIKTKIHNAAGVLVVQWDPLLNGTIAEASGVATITCDRGEFVIAALTDSDGAIEFPLSITLAPFAEQVILQAKQAGDTAAGHFGTLAAEVDGKV